MTAAQDPNHREWVLEILETFEARLTRYAERITRDSDLARDVVQYAFLRLCGESPETVKTPGPWLYAVCRNRAVDLLRKGKRMQPLNESHGELYPSRDPSPTAAAETKDSCDLLRRIVATLPAAQQEVVDLWSEGVGYQEIGRITNRSEGNVRVIVHRAFKTLREHPLAQPLLEAGGALRCG